MSNMKNLFSLFDQEEPSLVEITEAQNAVLEKDFERQEQPPQVVEAAPAILFAMPPVAYIKAGRRHQLVFEGVCTNCAHCSQPLSDAVSIERGIGPVCSKKGYLEDPKVSDEIQAMIDLAEFPSLVTFLVDRYKPQGVRSMMNALVKICSLNRRSPVHPACCDAIESLGYTRLASTLRESIAIIEITDCKEHPGNYLVWVKKSDWHWGWTNNIRNIPGAFPSRTLKGSIVPKSQKRALWGAMLKHYEGFCAKTPNGVVKILPPKVEQEQNSPDISPSQAVTSN